METKIILVQEEPRGPSQLIEIPVTSAAQKVPLPDVQQLRSQEGQVIILKALRLVTAKVLARAMTFDLANAGIAELRKICLVIYCEGWEKAQKIPLLTLCDYADADSAVATTIPYRFNATKFANWRNVDWAQSYLLYSNNTVAVPSYAVILEAEYVKLNALGQPIQGPS